MIIIKIIIVTIMMKLSLSLQVYRFDSSRPAKQQEALGEKAQGGLITEQRGGRGGMFARMRVNEVTQECEYVRARECAREGV